MPVKLGPLGEVSTGAALLGAVLIGLPLSIWLFNMAGINIVGVLGAALAPAPPAAPPAAPPTVPVGVAPNLVTVAVPNYKDTVGNVVTNQSVNIYLSGQTGTAMTSGNTGGDVQMLCGAPIDVLIGDDTNYYHVTRTLTIPCPSDPATKYAFNQLLGSAGLTVPVLMQVGSFAEFNAGGYNESEVYNVTSSGLQQMIAGVQVGVTSGNAKDTIINLQGANIPIVSMQYAQVTGPYSPTNTASTTISFGDVTYSKGTSTGNIILNYDSSATANLGSGSFTIVLSDLGGATSNPYEGLGIGNTGDSITVQWSV